VTNISKDSPNCLACAHSAYCTLSHYVPGQTNLGNGGENAVPLQVVFDMDGTLTEAHIDFADMRERTGKLLLAGELTEIVSGDST
jgi:hypothetical protein